MPNKLNLDYFNNLMYSSVDVLIFSRMCRLKSGSVLRGSLLAAEVCFERQSKEVSRGGENLLLLGLLIPLLLIILLILLILLFQLLLLPPPLLGLSMFVSGLLFCEKPHNPPGRKHRDTYNCFSGQQTPSSPPKSPQAPPKLLLTPLLFRLCMRGADVRLRVTNSQKTATLTDLAKKEKDLNILLLVGQPTKSKLFSSCFFKLLCLCCAIKCKIFTSIDLKFVIL